MGFHFIICSLTDDTQYTVTQKTKSFVRTQTHTSMHIHRHRVPGQVVTNRLYMLSLCSKEPKFSFKHTALSGTQLKEITTLTNGLTAQ